MSAKHSLHRSGVELADERTHLNAAQNRRIKHVDSRIDSVTNEFDWLFDEAVDDGRVRLGDDDTVGGRLGDFGHLVDVSLTVSLLQNIYLSASQRTDHDGAFATVC